MSIGTRGAKGRIVSTTVCGRRHCRVCTHWRLSIDFSVKRWDDAAKTRPRYLKSECHVCCVRLERKRLSAPKIREAKREYDRLRYHERRHGQRELHARREYRTSIYGEAGSPTLEVASAWAEEFEPALNEFNRHLYPNPYPDPPDDGACPSCWITGGVPCSTCPTRTMAVELCRQVRGRVASAT